MHRKLRNEKGFTLIASLLMLIMLTGMSVGLMYMTNTEARVGGNNLENNLAYYGAEAGLEKMTSDIGNLYSNTAPSLASINTLQAYVPTLPNISYTEYTIQVATDSFGNMATHTQLVSAGPNQGLSASIIPMTLSVTALRPSGAQVRLLRTIEVALIPVFQFGVFSDGDIDFFAGPYFNFGGRIHSNKNIFLAANSGPLELGSKVSAFGEIIRSNLENGDATSSGSYGGNVFIPNAPNGCPPNTNPPVGPNCRALALTEGSYNGMPGSGAANPAWSNISTSIYNGFIRTQATGAHSLKLPFVQPGVADSIEIIRKATFFDTPSVSTSREYNKAAIRVLLADTQPLLHPDRPALVDAEDVQLNNEAGSAFPLGITVTGVPAGTGNSYFAYANTTCGASAYCEPNDFKGAPAGFAAPLWPLINGWLRVEIRKPDGTWVGVTREWLQLGFARGLVPPTAIGANTYHPNAILILQEIADRNGDNILSCNGALPSVPDGQGRSESCNIVPGGGNSTPLAAKSAWYPINIYDTREGELRDTTGKTAGSVAPNGVLNVVELDVGNLRQWLTGAIPGTGNQVDFLSQNGYVLYFSDRRGMLPNPNDLIAAVPQVDGRYGYEDTINSSSPTGSPDGILDPLNFEGVSPEDVDANNLLDTWGGTNVGLGFGALNVNGGIVDPYFDRKDGVTIARKNWVSGARHALKLVDGTLGNLPTRPDGTGGFTVVAENPVYVLGDYNANGSGFGTPNAAAAVLADAVTLLTNAWTDMESFQFPFTVGNRNGVDTHYRLAISGGKNLPFARPTGTGADFGTDGGMHNFLRYLEGGGRTISYRGSMVSLYYSQYATGVFKCCNTVYGAPTRNYQFDTNFSDPTKLPPGTPEIQDVDNLSFHQGFTPQ